VPALEGADVAAAADVLAAHPEVGAVLRGGEQVVGLAEVKRSQPGVRVLLPPMSGS
jgi:hypothetical protein